jgi:phage gpG-like protein
MSINKVIKNIHKIAKAHQHYGDLLDRSAERIVREIKDNFDRGQNAGRYRVADAGSRANMPMDRPSKYTLERRENLSEAPLKDTGELYRSISVVGRSKLGRRVGAKGAKNKRKLYAQLGTGYTGVVSSDLGREIPPRNPVGFKESTWRQVRGSFLSAYGVNDIATGKINIGF